MSIFLLKVYSYKKVLGIDLVRFGIKGQNLSTFLENKVHGIENGGVDTTVIDSWHDKMGRTADFLPLLASSVFDL